MMLNHKGTRMIRKGIAVGIILFMLVSTSLVGVSNQPEKNHIDCQSTEITQGYLIRLAYPYNYNSIENESYQQYLMNQCSAKNTTTDDTFEYETILTQDETESTLMSGGLINSSWPMYCHDERHTGRSPYNTSHNPGAELWRIRLNGPLLTMSPAIGKDGVIYVPGTDLYAIYPNGTLQWKRDEGCEWMCPAIDENGTIYVGTESASTKYLLAIRPDGTKKWGVPNGYMSSTPTIGDDGIIYFSEQYFDDGSINAFYPNKTKKWEFYTSDEALYSSPAIGLDGTIYCGSHDNYLYALNPNGTLKWKFDTGTWVHGSPTIAEDGTVYIGADSPSYLFALNPDNGSVIWSVDLGGVWGAPAIDDEGILYVGDWYMNFYAIYPNGTIKWSYDAPGRVWFSSAALSADGNIYFGTISENGGVGSFVALDREGHELWVKYGGNYASSPIIDESGTVYVCVEHDYTWELIAYGLGPLNIDANGPYSIFLYQPVHFTGTIYGGVPPYFCHWDFGDGNTSNEQSPTYTYTHLGNYTVTFSVTDSDGNQSSVSSYVIVNAEAPTVTITKPINGIYILDVRILPFFRPFIIGPITIEVTATQVPFGIEKVEFYIDDKLKETDTEFPYQRTWNTTAFFRHIITVVAYDTSGISSTDELLVKKFF